MKQPYRITIEQYDQKVSIEKDYSDVTLEEFGEMLYNISMAAGWSEENLREIFIQ